MARSVAITAGAGALRPTTIAVAANTAVAAVTYSTTGAVAAITASCFDGVGCVDAVPTTSTASMRCLRRPRDGVVFIDCVDCVDFVDCVADLSDVSCTGAGSASTSGADAMDTAGTGAMYTTSTRAWRPQLEQASRARQKGRGVRPLAQTLCTRPKLRHKHGRHWRARDTTPRAGTAYSASGSATTGRLMAQCIRHWRWHCAHGWCRCYGQGRCWREVLHNWRWRCAPDRSRRHRHGGHRRNVHPHRRSHLHGLVQAPQTRQVLARRTLPLPQELRTLQMLARCTPPLALVLRVRSKRDALRHGRRRCDHCNTKWDGPPIAPFCGARDVAMGVFQGHAQDQNKKYKTRP